MKKLTQLRVVSVLPLALGVAACNAILGYDEAKLDTTATSQNQAQPLNCDTYCQVIMKNCTGMNQEYFTTEVCTSMCSHFEIGVPNDTASDSLSCRLFHANSAGTSPADHCKAAGPSGAGKCGTAPCNAFCLLDIALCTGSLLPYAGGESGCRAQCAQYMYNSDPAIGDLQFEDGNTLNCRLWHLESAYDPTNPTAAMTTHCPHTGKVSATCF